MKHFFILALLPIVVGCDSSYPRLKPIEGPAKQVVVATNYLGLHESKDRKELKSILGVDPMYYEWCAAFVNSVLEESGIHSNKTHEYSLMARSYLDWGVEVSPENIQAGDIVVFPRGTQGWQGHVGFYVRSIMVDDLEYYLILGGNQDNKVSIVRYAKHIALGIRRHEDSTN
jgi:uncharacterized protein (TIGR02594 family)